MIQINFREIKKILLIKKSLYQILRFFLINSHQIIKFKLIMKMLRIYLKYLIFLINLLFYSKFERRDDETFQF